MLRFWVLGLLIALSGLVFAVQFPGKTASDVENCIRKSSDYCDKTICGTADDPTCASQCLKDAEEDCRHAVSPL